MRARLYSDQGRVVANVARWHSGHRHCGWCAHAFPCRHVRVPVSSVAKDAIACAQAHYDQLNIVKYLVSRPDLDNTMNDVHRCALQTS